MGDFKWGVTAHLNKHLERKGALFEPRFDCKPLFGEDALQSAVQRIYLNIVQDVGILPEHWAGVCSWSYHNAQMPFVLELNQLGVKSLRASQQRFADKEWRQWGRTTFLGQYELKIYGQVDMPSIRREILRQYGSPLTSANLNPQPQTQPNQADKTTLEPDKLSDEHKAYIKMHRQIQLAYQDANRLHRQGLPTEFPYGTIMPGHRVAKMPECESTCVVGVSVCAVGATRALRQRTSKCQMPPNMMRLNMVAIAGHWVGRLKVLSVQLSVVRRVHVDKLRHLKETAVNTFSDAFLERAQDNGAGKLGHAHIRRLNGLLFEHVVGCK